MNKRALFMKFIIALVVLTVTLTVILILIARLNPEENIDLQACRASVEARSTFNLGNVIEPGRDFIPLNCKTEKICISISGEDCTETQGFTPSKENKINKIKTEKDNARQLTLDTISQSLRDCHFQLGQGELNFMPSRTFSKNYCPICARTALDKEARENVKNITWIEIYAHMQKRKDSNGISDLKYVYGVDSVQELFPILEKVTRAIEEEHENKVKVEISDLSAGLGSPQGTAVIAQVSTPGNLVNLLGLGTGTALIGGGIVAIAAAPFTGGATLFAWGAIATVGGVGAGIGGAYADTGTILGDSDIALASGPILISTIPGGTDYAHPTLYNYDAELLSSLECTSFEFLPKTS